MLARELRKHRRHKKAEQRHDQHKQQQCQRVVAAVHVRPDAQAGVKPDLRRQPAQQRKACQAHCKHQDDAFDDVLVLEVAQLMRQHRINFTGLQLFEQRVVKHHALGRTKTGEIGVGMGRAFATVHHKQALCCKTAALHQGCYTGF